MSNMDCTVVAFSVFWRRGCEGLGIWVLEKVMSLWLIGIRCAGVFGWLGEVGGSVRLLGRVGSVLWSLGCLGCIIVGVRLWLARLLLCLDVSFSDGCWLVFRWWGIWSCLLWLERGFVLD